MPLLGNYNVLAKNPIRSFSGTAVSGDRSNSNRGGMNRNRFFNDGNQDSTLGTAPENNSVPSGYLPPYCWIMAQNDPTVASRNNITGGSTVGASLTVAQAMTASLSGSSTISPSVDKIAPITSSLAGSSAVTASVVSPVGLTSDLSGTSTVTSDSTGKTYLTAGLSGSSSLSATGYQLVSLAGDIVSGGQVLDTSNVASAVLAGIIENGYNLRDVLALMAARELGNSGGGPNTPAYKGLDGVTTRVTGTADSSGNRTGMTLTPR